MRCDNCTDEADIAYTLLTYVEGENDPVVTDFCSIDCLQDWTGNGGLDEWRWGPDAPVDGVVADGGENR